MSAQQYGISEKELVAIKQQAALRAANRREFLKQISNPYRHASEEGGYVFDPAIQRFSSMKATQLERFVPNYKSAIKSFCLVIVPMALYAYAFWYDRSTRENRIRTGELKYRDRMFKLQ